MAGHDISDGGLITCILEMAFAGISGLDINISHKSGSPIDILFSEEVGWILEIEGNNYEYLINAFKQFNIPIYLIGKSVGLGFQSKVISMLILVNIYYASN